MYHDPALATAARVPLRPASAVSHGVGLAGLAGLVAWLVVTIHYRMDGPYAALVGVAACGVPMVLWSLLVDRVHRNPSTGIDWHAPRAWSASLDVSLTKLAGLWLTWAGIALIYATGRFYGEMPFAFAMWCLTAAAPALFVLSIPYVLWLDRHLADPRDGAWHLGAWLLGTGTADVAQIQAHLRAWAVKAFFLAFMLAIVPGGFGEFVAMDPRAALADPVRLANWLITFMFVVDVAFATVGYLLTMRPLDAHIRSANPFMAAWTAALICYPPFIMMDDGRPFDYRPGTADWTHWMQGHPLLLAITGAVLVALTGIYAWATVAFGLRFSNLTNRGVLTHGPYAWSRHPAYLAKNLFWWISTIPLLSTGSLVDAARATILLGVVSGIYYWRAKTEERHLREDPAYRDYDAWIEAHGAVPRFLRWARGSSSPRA
ncbi:methyltransferase family protein [Sphingomonas adhaesiva]|uniref:methyltransferase family protein n=1 Tax=Sphingomonas adhaesiva TaxID=28212 RepID=UPI002FFB70A0